MVRSPTETGVEVCSIELPARELALREDAGTERHARQHAQSPQRRPPKNETVSRTVFRLSAPRPAGRVDSSRRPVSQLGTLSRRDRYLKFAADAMTLNVAYAVHRYGRDRLLDHLRKLRVLSDTFARYQASSIAIDEGLEIDS